MIYIFLLFGIGILGLLKKRVRHKKTIDFIVLLIMTIIYGIRYNVGIDYLSYERIYINQNEWYHLEFLFDLTSKIFKFFNAPFWVYSTFLGFIIFYLLYLIGKDLDIGYEQIMLYFILTGQLFASFNLVRQTVSAVIVLFAFRYINYKNNLYKYVICVVIASFFHTTAIILIPLYFMRNYQLNLRRIVIFIILGLGLYYCDAVNYIMRLIQLIVPDKYIHYLGGVYDFNTNPGIGVLFYIVVVIILGLKIEKKESKYYPYIATYILGYSIFLFTLSSFIINRLLAYCYISLVPVLPYLVMKSRRKGDLLTLIYIGIVFVFMIMFAAMIFDIYGADTNNLMYKTVFNIPIF